LRHAAFRLFEDFRRGRQVMRAAIGVVIVLTSAKVFETSALALLAINRLDSHSGVCIARYFNFGW
jgi:hypothetical protein